MDGEGAGVVLKLNSLEVPEESKREVEEEQAIAECEEQVMQQCACMFERWAYSKTRSCAI